MSRTVFVRPAEIAAVPDGVGVVDSLGRSYFHLAGRFIFDGVSYPGLHLEWPIYLQETR